MVIAVTAAALLGAGGAAAATPQQIYRDLADNGRLDRDYSRVDIERALGTGLRSVLKEAPPRQPANSRPEIVPPAGVERPAARGGKHNDRRVPFTGIDLALLTAVGGPLLLIGAGVRRRLHPKAEPVVSA